MAIELELYKRETKCIKCGSDLVTAEYIPHLELIRRNCSECGYSWHQVPLDRKHELEKEKK